ncbi:type I methionyl aminopeptidase [Ruminococcaceae bacterium OttesenSCG-928-O06]|nr:type I methionyl aminopeptidase [Ruminococcaceae bacterium OttesenSCG-928-O06]
MIRLKTAAELASMRRACEVSAGALAAGGAAVRPGATTKDVDDAVEAYIRSHGGIPNFKGYNGFPAAACVSVGDTVIHGIPAKSHVLQEGDIVSIDTGAIVEGFHGDNAYTFPCGAISPGAEHLLRTTRASLFAAIAAAQPGARIGDIGHAVQSYVEAEGYSVVRDFVGHGVGAELHEAPEVPNFGRAGHGARLVPGMTLAIEPMINEKGAAIHILNDGWTVKTKDGGLSAHFEHTVLITAEGPEILTQWQVDPWNS